jgi:citrate/tricarballylate utilization protein
MLKPLSAFEEAERQLTICNSCRYCEGYCAVFPALERLTTVTSGDAVFLANLCHDCRACHQACAYSGESDQSFRSFRSPRRRRPH